MRDGIQKPCPSSAPSLIERLYPRNPAGNQVIAGLLRLATAPDGVASEPERFIMVTDWAEELRQRTGN